jgi:hypothetical protein
MAGIQYSTARTDATHAEATGAFPFPSSLRGRRAARRRTIRSRTLLAGTRANLRSAEAKNPPAGELPHMGRARAALRHRCDAEEEPMTDLAARLVYSPLLSTAFKVVCLFCVLGLALSVAIVPMIAPEYLAWVLSHIE